MCTPQHLPRFSLLCSHLKPFRSPLGARDPISTIFKGCLYACVCYQDAHITVQPHLHPEGREGGVP